MPTSISRLTSRATALLTFALLITTAVAFTVRNVVTAQSSTAQTDTEAAIRQVLMDNAAGFERNDIALLNRVWANDETVTVFESGHANYGWADYRDHHLVPEMADFKNTKYTLSDIRPRLAGNTAWATYKYKLTADFKGRKIDATGLGTAILEQRDGRWQIIHSHTSAARRPTPAPSPAKSTSSKKR